MKLGIYEHFKGKKYKVIGLVKHSEKLEEMVLYRPLEKNEFWVRPLKVLTEEVEVAGRKIHRFRYFK